MVLACREFLTDAADADDLAQGRDLTCHSEVSCNRSIDSAWNERSEKGGSCRWAIFGRGSHRHMEMIAILVEVFDLTKFVKQVEYCDLDHFYTLREDFS